MPTIYTKLGYLFVSGQEPTCGGLARLKIAIKTDTWDLPIMNLIGGG